MRIALPVVLGYVLHFHATIRAPGLRMADTLPCHEPFLPVMIKPVQAQHSNRFTNGPGEIKTFPHGASSGEHLVNDQLTGHHMPPYLAQRIIPDELAPVGVDRFFRQDQRPRSTGI
jgi:hypothetical protein